jgi:vesicle-fusing ATPase
MTILQVGNLPSNRLALTNKVYLNPSTLQSLFSNNPESTSIFLVTVASHPYLADAHQGVAPDQVALNGLQRRHAQFSLATRVEVKRYRSPPEAILSALEISVDLLSKKSSTSGHKPREIDTDRLMDDFINNYVHQMVQPGQVLAMDFEGTKIELTISKLDFLSENYNHAIGQITAPTEVSFRKAQGTKLITLSGSRSSGGKNSGGSSIFLGDFDFVKLGIGGLDAEFNRIFRRAFASRIWPAHIIQQMGITHVRGMLLYGPPGCGKTLIARQIGKILNAREPKIVNGPEILNKFVGGSEEKVRELFAEAEKEQAEEGEHSMLHIIILDEMDAICKQRGSNSGGTGVSDSVVNQLLSKIDGVDSLNNILLIGMTNRKDMIDDALLRPGRLELHVEIGLPDRKGRTQILNIHTKSMKEANRMSPEAMSGLDMIADKTKNFSGAEIEGLIKAATSYALTRCVDVKDLSKPPDEENLIVKLEDLERALGDVEAKFGAKSTELKALYRNGFVPYGESFDFLMNTMDRLVEQGKFVLL